MVYIRILNKLFDIEISFLRICHTVVSVQIQKCKYNHIKCTHCNNNILEASQTSQKGNDDLSSKRKTTEPLQKYRIKSIGLVTSSTTVVLKTDEQAAKLVSAQFFTG